MENPSTSNAIGIGQLGIYNAYPLNVHSPIAALKSLKPWCFNSVTTRWEGYVADDVDPSRRPEQQLSDSSSDVPRSTAYLSPVDFSSAIATVATTPIAPSSDWNMEDIVWSNMPWDWNLVDEFLMGHEQF